MRRRLVIELGETTDQERCGDCPSRGISWCELFDVRLYRDDPELGPLRWDECREAEESGRG